MTGNRQQMGSASGPMRPSNSLPELIDRLLDHGLVIESWIGISLAGQALTNIQARVVVASIDTYLTYAGAITQISLPSAREDKTERVPQGSAEDALTPYLNASPESPSDHGPPIWYKIAPN